MFYKETNFKETPIGEIPREWKVVRATDVARYINGYAFGPEDWKTKGVPIIRIQNLNDPNAEFNYFDGEIDEIYRVNDGDLLFSWSASIGVYIWKGGEAVLNQHIFKVIPSSQIDKLFLYYVLFLAIEQLKRKVHGSTMKHFRRGELRTTFIPLPPPLEQQKIASILSTVDEAIQKTVEVIAKTERLKKGLMQELLTKGIGHKEFKDTDIGKIPKDWEITKLGVCDFKRGFSYRSDQITSHKTQIRFITINDIEKEGGLKKEAEKIYVKEDVKTCHDFFVNEGDVLIANTDMAKGFIIGAPILIKNMKEKCVYSMDLTKLVFDKSKIYGEFLFYYLTYEPMRKKMKTSAQGTNVLHLNHRIISNFFIPLPSLLEQQKIAEILSTVDKKLELEKNKKAILERIKQGLMDSLLTGKIRVKVV